MAIRNLPNTDGLPTFEVDTAEELTQLLIPGVYVRASREVLAAAGGRTPRTPIPRRSWPGPTGAMTRGSPTGATSHATGPAAALGVATAEARPRRSHRVCGDPHRPTCGRHGAVANAVDTRHACPRGTPQHDAAGRAAPEKELSDGMGAKESHRLTRRAGTRTTITRSLPARSKRRSRRASRRGRNRGSRRAPTPKNIQTDKPYRGGNSVYLSVTQTAKGYSDHRWATYKQIKEMGGQVRKGEKATHVLFYKFDDEREKAQPPRPTSQPARPRARPSETARAADGPLLRRL